MTGPCTQPISWSDLVEYWAGEVDAAEVDRIDEHLFGCESCSALSQRLAQIAAALRNSPPPVVSAADVDALRSRGLVIEENRFLPGEVEVAHFRADVDVMIHRLGGLDLTGVERVSVLIGFESSEDVQFEDYFVPFDRALGEVWIACQRHFAGLPPDVVFEVRAHHGDGAVTSARYSVPHTFDR